ncbi:recombinase-like helix-turn-helix domain-containing protein [Streptomyces sp. 142MFCol3.1]|uniref:recombinase-like helix-turn-helix domain-containing protein n=1 Tax=Streptomyces sp. 142MFCol3.1 TaxID=1172179 RepID=UPI0003F6A754|nr:recombinase-like helix-turn-helix domain-containing protein [Streptomyces sp. 142MFCol3.1]
MTPFGVGTIASRALVNVAGRRLRRPSPGRGARRGYRLAATLEEVFTKDGHELADVIAGLNARQVHAPDGDPWTEESFRAEMHRLGA